VHSQTKTNHPHWLTLCLSKKALPGEETVENKLLVSQWPILLPLSQAIWALMASWFPPACAVMNQAARNPSLGAFSRALIEYHTKWTGRQTREKINRRRESVLTLFFYHQIYYKFWRFRARIDSIINQVRRYTKKKLTLHFIRTEKEKRWRLHFSFRLKWQAERVINP
jgi:hypothetical protein